MKAIRERFKKGTAVALTAALLAGLVPALPGATVSVKAADGTTKSPSVSTYATKDQLMDDTFKPNSKGTAETVGKLVFGKNSDGNPQEWYILGADSGVSGGKDNTIIFATSPIATKQVFENDSSNNKTFDSSFGVYASNPTEVYPNHYGASDLRVALKSMANGLNENYFTTAEQNLMNATTVTTKDRLNGATYTTTDKLYALQEDFYDRQKLLAGTSDSTVLARYRYWSSGGDEFWLRTAYVSKEWQAVLAIPYQSVDQNSVSTKQAVQPASNLNLSSVLFASAATAASSGTESGSITADMSMTLRLDGTGKDIGTVTYNTTTGDIKVVKGSTAQTVSLVVQGNDGTDDWYYSKKIDTSETVNASAIKSALSFSSDINLSDCKIWLETTDNTENLTYAVNATEIVVSVSSVAITDIDTPVSNTALDIEASCTTEGVSSTTPQITWTPSDTTAGYNTSYTASITLTAAIGYKFADNVTATVSGNPATSVTKNADGTLTVTKEFTTDKRKIESVAAPTVPANNILTTYYGYDGYAATPISGTNTELGKTATVTFEGTTSPATEDMAVTWTIESDGGVYDRTPGAENTFRWTIPESALTNYNAVYCQGYDTSTGNITGTITLKNKAATPVVITGTDSSIAYTGATVDVSQYFGIDTNAGTATYTLVTGTNGGTGEGTLSGTTLTVTRTGTFKIKVSTVADGIFAAGEKTVTLTVDNGTILYAITATAGANGSISPSGTVKVASGGSQTFTITPATGYEIDTLKVDGSAVSSATSYTFSNVDKAHTIEAIFKKTQSPEPTPEPTPAVVKPVIKTQPADVSIKADEKATFTVSASGADLIYQWQIDRNDGNGWVNIAGANEASYTTSTVDISCNGFKHQCVVSNTAGSVTSNTAVLTVTENTTPAPDSVDYEILDGANTSWEQNSDGSLSIRGSGEFSKFVGVKVDGNLVDVRNYTVKEGSTIVTLKADYLNTLSVGNYTFEIIWTDGTASTRFTVSKSDYGSDEPTDNDGNNGKNDNTSNTPATAPEDKNNNGTGGSQTDDNQQITAPKTGDNSHTVLWISLLGVSLAGLLSMIYVRKKKENE